MLLFVICCLCPSWQRTWRCYKVFGCLELCFGISTGGGVEFNKKGILRSSEISDPHFVWNVWRGRFESFGSTVVSFFFTNNWFLVVYSFSFLFFLCCPLILGYFASMRANFGIANLRVFGEKTILPLWFLEFWSSLFLHLFCWGDFHYSTSFIYIYIYIYI